MSVVPTGSWRRRAPGGPASVIMQHHRARAGVYLRMSNKSADWGSRLQFFPIVAFALLICLVYGAGIFLPLPAVLNMFIETIRHATFVLIPGF